jgi:hypothetical protein
MKNLKYQNFDRGSSGLQTKKPPTYLYFKQFGVVITVLSEPNYCIMKINKVRIEGARMLYPDSLLSLLTPVLEKRLL